MTIRAASLAKPSTFYRAGPWQLGLVAAKNLSPAVASSLMQQLSRFYWRFNARRREVVEQNLLPAANGNRDLAQRLSNELFQQFAIKLVDLWRYESGMALDELFLDWTGWDRFVAVRAEGRGVLLLTPHLGNWEFGAPLLARQGVPLLVITLMEPQSRLTQLRKCSRARWGIETLVIGEDTFAFVEVIRRLEAGATVALLIDRPPAASSVTVELFGRPFSASIAAAELARATGCALLPVYLPRSKTGYSAHILSEIRYDRQVLAKRQGRQHLTQEMMRAFEPVIREHITQWFHFVPIWPKL